MDNRNNPYRPYLMYLLSQMMKGGTGLPPIGQITGQNPPSPAPAKAEALQNAKETGPAEDGGRTYFGQDETGCSWRREERIDLLEKFCREGCFMARKHGHFLIGQSREGSFIAIPGRFLLEEQPAGGVTGFTLWQPLAGGEGLYESLETMDEEAAKTVYGYWIARLDPKTLTISEA